MSGIILRFFQMYPQEMGDYLDMFDSDVLVHLYKFIRMCLNNSANLSFFLLKSAKMLLKFY